MKNKIKVYLIVFLNGAFNLSKTAYGYNETIDENGDVKFEYSENVRLIREIEVDEDVVDFQECYKINKEDGLVLISEKALEQAKEQREKEQKEQLLRRLMVLCAEKHEAGKVKILGHKSEPTQLERYESKLKRAQNGDFSEAENNAIIAKANEATAMFDGFVDMIEMVRQSIEAMIEAGNIEKAEKAMSAAQEFDSTTTAKDIAKALK